MMFKSYEKLWSQHPARQAIETDITRIVTTNGPCDPHFIRDNLLPANKTSLNIILRPYIKRSGFRQPAAHISALAAEMARTGVITHTYRGRKNIYS